MLLKTATSLAFATACLTALATAPGAQAQPANMSGTSGSTYQNQQAPRSDTSWSQGGYGSTSENYAPQSYQGNMAPSSAGMSNDELVTNGPQGTPPANWSARQNVIQSRHYTRMLESNAGFRHARMRKECGPVTDPQLHANCIASFSQYAQPMYGSSEAPHTYRSGYGR